MKHISKYNQGQLSFTYNNLIAFENHQIELDSLIGTLEFLLNAMEFVEDAWEEQFLQGVTVLESINARAIEAPKISRETLDSLIKKSVSNLKLLIGDTLTQCLT